MFENVRGVPHSRYCRKDISKGLGTSLPLKLFRVC